MDDRACGSGVRRGDIIALVKVRRCSNAHATGRFAKNINGGEAACSPKKNAKPAFFACMVKVRKVRHENVCVAYGGMYKNI